MTTRRTILAAIGSLPVAAVAVPSLASAEPIDRAEWDRAFAAMLRAKAASDADDVRHGPIEDAYFAAKEAVPHVTVGPDPYRPHSPPATTADTLEVQHARRGLSSVRYLEFLPGVLEHHQWCVRLTDADEARAAEIQRIDDRLGYSASARRNEQLTDAYCDATSALLAMPAPDAAALAWKIEHLWGDEADDPGMTGDGSSSSYTMKWVGQIVRDARRLLGGEG